MYKRIILKLSGEALAGDRNDVRFDNGVIAGIVEQIKTVLLGGTEVALVIGGGNFWRGRSADSQMDRTKADQIGMLATVMNAIYVADFLRQVGVEAVVQTPFRCGTMTEEFSKDTALHHLQAGRVVIFAGGLGHPFFSTDTGAVLRAAEIEADAILLAKNIDGVYSADPLKDPNAVKYDTITYDEILAQHLAVMDTTATSLSMDNHIPIVLFALKDPENIYRVIMGEKIGTIVKEEA